MRRILIAATLAVVALTTIGQSQTHAIAVPRHRVSQLIGVGADDPYEFQSWLGRPLDIWQAWNNYPDWAGMEQVPSWIAGTTTAPFNKPWPGRLEMGQPLWAADETAATCANGGDDVHYRAIAEAFKRAGFGDTIIRLGWEQNGDWFWWHATSDNVHNWISCFQHAYIQFKSVDPRFLIEWSPNKSTDMAGFDTRTTYPGNKYVDLIGVDFYDHYPAYPDQATWREHYNDTENGGSPTGIGSWIAYAESHHKQIDFAEWGLDEQNDPQNPDNAFFINKMADTFHRLGAELFEQSVFAFEQQPPCNFAIHVGGCNPDASAAYLHRFGRKR